MVLRKLRNVVGFSCKWTMTTKMVEEKKEYYFDIKMVERFFDQLMCKGKLNLLEIITLKSKIA